MVQAVQLSRKKGRFAQKAGAKSKAQAPGTGIEVKRTSKQKKDLDRAETQFKTGLKKIFSDGCLDDVEFCKQQLLDNPTWVAWAVTCKLFRNGSFAKMASIEALEAAELERAQKWGGAKVKGLKCLNIAKPSLRDAFLNEVNPAIVQNAQDDAAKQAAYNFALETMSATYTLPSAQEYRYEKVYVLAALWLYRQLGSRLDDRDSKGKTVQAEDFNLWAINKNEITFVPTAQKQDFEFLDDEDMDWEINNLNEVDAIMRTKRMKRIRVALNEHFKIPDTTLVWGQLPWPDDLLEDHEKRSKEKAATAE